MKDGIGMSGRGVAIPLELTSLCETIPANKLLTANEDPKVKKTKLTPKGPS